MACVKLDFNLCLLATFAAVDEDQIVLASDKGELLRIEERFHNSFAQVKLLRPG